MIYYLLMLRVMIILFINVCLTVAAAFTRVNQQRQFSLKQTVT